MDEAIISPASRVSRADPAAASLPSSGSPSRGPRLGAQGSKPRPWGAAWRRKYYLLARNPMFNLSPTSKHVQSEGMPEEAVCARTATIRGSRWGKGGVRREGLRDGTCAVAQTLETMGRSTVLAWFSQTGERGSAGDSGRRRIWNPGSCRALSQIATRNTSLPRLKLRLTHHGYDHDIDIVYTVTVYAACAQT